MDKKDFNKGTNLQKLREAFDASKDDGGGGGYNWFKPQWGENVVRILPAIDKEDLFFHATARHRVDSDFYYCLKYHVDLKTGRGEKCPICEARTRFFRSGDPELIKLAKDIKAKKQFLINLIDRNSEDPAKVFLYAAGVKIYNKMVSAMLDDEIDITDIENGFDFVVKKEEGPTLEDGKSFPSYDNSRAKRKISPLHAEAEVAQKILENRNDLKSVPRFDSAEALQAALDGYLQSLNSGTAKAQQEQFYEGSEKESEPSSKAKSTAAAFKDKLAASLRQNDDDELADDEA